MLKILINGDARLLDINLSRSLLEDGIVVFGGGSPNNYYGIDLKLC